MSTEARATPDGKRKVTQAEQIVIRFAGDSGDGIQITGGQFTRTSAIVGNDIASFPDFPAEIRAPRGTMAGVSGFQLQFAAHEIFTPGDGLDALVAFNPAALRANVQDLSPNGLLILNVDEFQERDLTKAGYDSNPLEDGSLDGFRVFQVPITTLTRRALEGTGLPAKDVDRCKNFFALGMSYWLFERPLAPTNDWIAAKFAGKDTLVEANQTALKAGHAYCDATEAYQERYQVEAAPVSPGTYRNINGNSALSMGLVAAGVKSNTPLVYCSYPITPASDILHEMAGFRRFGVTTFQAEDEIAAIAAAIGASFAGKIGITGTSGPGLALKMEALGLAVMAELPLVVVCVQRGGPSTGLPTKTEQADLLFALYGRSSESPVAVLAPSTPGDCFHVAFEAARLAVKYVTPVIILSDGYLANGAEPWRVPAVADLPEIPVVHPTDPGNFEPYARDPETLARPWAVPGTPGLEHRIGGLEKAAGSGNVSYVAANHQSMVETRQAKIDRITADIPPLEVHGDVDGGELLVVGWGSTAGAITSAVNEGRQRGLSVSSIHLRHLNPLPADLPEVLGRFRNVLVPEMNLGQLSMLIRARYLVDTIGLNKVEGRPFTRQEILSKCEEILGAAARTGATS